MKIKDYVSHILNKDLSKLSLFERMVVSEEQTFLREKFNPTPVLNYIEFLNKKIIDANKLTSGSQTSLINQGRISRRDLLKFQVDMYHEIKSDKSVTYRDIYKHINTSEEYKNSMNKILFERVKFKKSNSTK